MIKKVYSKAEQRYVYRYDIRVNDGNRKRRVRGTASTSELAKQAIAAAKADAARGEYQFRGDRVAVSIRELADQVVAKKEAKLDPDSIFIHRSTLDRFCELIGGKKRVSEIDEGDLARYKKLRKQAGIAPSTMNKELGAIMSCLRDAPKVFKKSFSKYRPPVIELEHDPKPRRQRKFAAWEINALMTVMRDHYPLAAEVFALALGADLRIGEAVKLEWAHVLWHYPEYRYGALHIAATKTKRDRIIPIGRKVRALLERRRAMAGVSKWVFPSPHRRGTHYGKMYYAMMESCKLAGIPYGRNTPGGIIIHDIRRTGRSQMRRKKIDPDIAAKQAGHTVAVMIEFYNSPDPELEQAAADALDELIPDGASAFDSIETYSDTLPGRNRASGEVSTDLSKMNPQSTDDPQ